MSVLSSTCKWPNKKSVIAGLTIICCPKTTVFCVHFIYTAVIQERFANSTKIFVLLRGLPFVILSQDIWICTVPPICCVKKKLHSPPQTKWLWSVYLEMVFGLLWDYCEVFALQSPSTALINRAEYGCCTWQRAGSQSLSFCLTGTVITYNGLQTCLALIQTDNYLSNLAIRSDIVFMKWHTWAWQVC